MTIKEKSLTITAITGQTIPDISTRSTIRHEAVEVLDPETWRQNPETAAQIIIKILGANYGTHNVTSDTETLAQDIIDGGIVPFITPEHDACAALIQLGQFDVELGRAACLPGTNGGKSAPIYTAFEAWRSGAVFPQSQVLRAEVRTAKPTKEVPGGLATQAIFLRKCRLNFCPTAIGPFFHHGCPDRQEMFILASTCKNPTEIISMAKTIIVPNIIFTSPTEENMLNEMWRMAFETNIRLESVDKRVDCGFSIQDDGPFITLLPTKKTDFDWKRALLKGFDMGQRFALARLPLNKTTSPVINGGIEDLRNFGFKLVGFEPTFNQNGISISLLMGKLSKEGQQKLISSCFPEGVFTHHLEDLLLQNTINWRENEK